MASPNPDTGTGYFVQLDGLRAVAVFGVMLTHWTTLTPRIGFHLGILGVNLFFVLSGFLISGILLRSRDASSGRVGAARIMRTFYIRRGLRLLPLAYAVLLIACLSHPEQVRPTVHWHLFYVGNFLFARDGWMHPTTHLWSLAVEEQFYLVWPWVILLAPRRQLGAVIGCVIALAPLCRVLLHLGGYGNTAVRVLPMSAFDMFGVGALLALWAQTTPLRELVVTRRVRLMGGIGLPLLILAALCRTRYPVVYTLGHELGSALFFGWVVASAAAGFQGILGSVLRSRPMVYTGKISYGLYVIHNFMPDWVAFFMRSDVGHHDLPPKRLIIVFAATFLLAGLSWRTFEAPIQRLKRKFAYEAA